MGALQIISVVWGKQARHAAAATLRNRLPRGFVLSRDPLAPAGLHTIEHYAFRQDGASEPYLETKDTKNRPHWPKNASGLLLEASEEGLVLRLDWDISDHGRPYRARRDALCVLQPGQSCQIRVNGRHGVEGEWYSQHTFNVACGEKPPSDVFTRSVWTHTLNLEERIYRNRIST